jgi:mediator of RNA polymerase II transcription subunit 7
MAEPEQAYENYALPPPPPFYKNFTEKNLQRLKELKEGEDGEARSRALTWLDLPTELRYLIPPEPPEDGVVKNFGEVKTVRVVGSQNTL